MQEIISGREFYKTDNAIVVTNSYFTNPARQMAKECHVELWDREDCKRISANEDKTMGNDYIDEIIDDMLLDGSETADEIKKANEKDGVFYDNSI